MTIQASTSKRSRRPEVQPDSARALLVHYVTMQFPAPSETFASQDVRRLRSGDVDFEVHGMRLPHPRAHEMLRERGLQELPVRHNGLRATVRGLARMAAHPGLALRTLRWVVRRNATAAGHLWRSLVLLPRAFDIYVEIERAKPDVVHVYWGHYPSLVAFLVQERLPRVAVSISLNAYDLEMEYAGSIDVARRADVVRTHASVNVAHVARFTGIDPERIEVVFNGVDLERLDALVRGTSKISRRIATVGRLVESKGMFEAVEAFARVHQRYPDATLTILGDGPARSALQRRAEELGVHGVVTFEGHVTHDRVLRALAEAEVALLLTRGRAERLPNVVKEGMACRCINVTTPTPGIEELLVDGKHGFVVPAGDPQAAAEAVERVFAGQVDRSAMQHHARRRIEEAFDLSATTGRYLELWKAAAARSRNRGTSDV